MSGHSRWATIRRKKGAQDAKRGLCPQASCIFVFADCCLFTAERLSDPVGFGLQ